MKKYFVYLFALTAVTLFTACGDSDEPDHKTTFTSTINSRAIEGDNLVFSQGSAKVEFDNSNMFIQFTSNYKDIDGQSHTITSPSMKLYAVSGTVYTFNDMASSTYSGFDGLEGYFDIGTGMMWFTFMDGSTRIISTSNILYAYTNTVITNPVNGNQGNHNQSAYLFAPDARGETCAMEIYNFVSTLNGAVDAVEILYEGLTLTPTTTGYTVTADKVESSYKGYYTLTDVNFILDDQCRVINGSFKCNDLEQVVTGGMFSYATPSSPVN